MRRKVFIAAFTGALFLLSSNLVHAGQWVGPNLVTNGTFSGNLNGWEEHPAVGWDNETVSGTIKI